MNITLITTSVHVSGWLCVTVDGALVNSSEVLGSNPTETDHCEVILKHNTVV